VFPLWLNMAIGVTLFLVMNIILGIKYSIADILLSYTGIKSIGNSNWFIFTTLVLYAFTLICFNGKVLKLLSYKKSLIIFTALSILYITCGQVINNTLFVNTCICFSAGMWFSEYKDSFERFLKNKYFLKLFLSYMVFLILFILNKKLGLGNNNFFYSIYSISFVLCILVTSMKVSLNNKVFEFLGQHLFWIYVLQRIPMICLKGKIDNNYLYFMICFIITILMSYAMNKFSKFVLQKEKNTLETRS
jgi:hypothetical protein